MMIYFAKCTGRTLIVGLLDFEKAFDYTNRKILISSLIEDGIGCKLAGAIKDMYLETKYIPKLGGNRIGDEIESKFGVTQGRKSSANFGSEFLSPITFQIWEQTLNRRMQKQMILWIHSVYYN